MTLGFSTQIKDKPTYFVEQINNSLIQNGIVYAIDIDKYERKYSERFGFNLREIIEQKIHSIREDKHNRWHAGNHIHFVINNRTKNRFQFAPVIPCIETQKIQIFWDEPQNYHKDLWQTPVEIIIDGNHTLKPDIGDILIDSVTKEILQGNKEAKLLAINDGFESLKDFLLYFNKDFTGKIIHWTDLKY